MISWAKALDLEIRVAQIINTQEINGVKFDLLKANNYIQDLHDLRGELYEEIRPQLDLEIINPYTVPVNKPFLASGGHSKTAVNWMKDNVELVGGPFTRVGFVEPDIGSRQKLIKQLLKHGWKPKLFTPKGQPKITDQGAPVSTLQTIKGEMGSKISKWYQAGHRKSQIEGWVKNVRSDGRIMAGADSCGTNTARMRHRVVEIIASR